MAGLIEEIQSQALNPDAQVSDLLRKVKVAAVKLKLEEAIDWVDKELGGYIGVEEGDLPPYRRGHGTLIQHTPFSRRAIHGDTMMVAAMSQVFLREPLSSLEDIARSDGTKCNIGVNVDLQDALKKGMGIENCSFSVDFGKNMVVSAIASVRDLVLDWSLNLETQGILGEGITFTMEEKQKAAEVAGSITIQNFNGHLHQGDTNGDQNKVVIGSTDNSVNTITTENVFDQAIHAINSKIANQNDREELAALVEAMKGAQGTENYTPLFQKWVGYLAEYVTVLGPFFPALSQLAG